MTYLNRDMAKQYQSLRPYMYRMTCRVGTQLINAKRSPTHLRKRGILQREREPVNLATYTVHARAYICINVDPKGMD